MALAFGESLLLKIDNTHTLNFLIRRWPDIGRKRTIVWVIEVQWRAEVQNLALNVLQGSRV